MSISFVPLLFRCTEKRNDIVHREGLNTGTGLYEGLVLKPYAWGSDEPKSCPCGVSFQMVSKLNHNNCFFLQNDSDM